MDGEASMDLPSALSGYDRAAVQGFLKEAAIRRAHLEGVIADASERRERAIATHAANRAVVEGAQRELAEIRAHAEARASQLLVAARLEAQLLLRAAREQASRVEREERSVDLRGHELLDAALDGSVGVTDEDYFEYLRGALRVDSPGAE
jgi:cell division septum initiation protein DivIVA